MVIPLANTGMEIIINIEVIIIDQQYSDRLFKNILFEFIFSMEIIKFIDLKIDEIPFKWSDRIVILIDVEFWMDKGGYIVHPVKILFFTNILIVSIISEGNKIHILKLFSRG